MASRRFDPPPPPSRLKIRPSRALAPQRAEYVSVHFGDLHIPYQHRGATKLLYGLISELKPDLLVDHGDTLDFPQISKYEKNPLLRQSLQSDFKEAAAHFGTLRATAPSADIWWILGNHEDRLRKRLWELSRNPEAAALVQLGYENGWYSLEEQLSLKRLGVKMIPAGDHELLHGKIILSHGDSLGANAAKNEYWRYKKSGLSGHIHKRQTFETRDYNGHHLWMSLGCLCDPKQAGSYTTWPDWHLGFAVVSFDASRKHFGVEMVRIHEEDGVTRMMFRGKLYEEASNGE